MTQSSQADTARLTLALNELRLPAIKALWPQFTEQADKEGWPASRLLATLVEHELAERDRRRIARHLTRHACCLVRRSRLSTLLPSLCCQKLTSARSPLVTVGSQRAAISCCSARRVWASRILPRQ